jgi:2-iminobutanoate/2-iminopropanoate deaminase
MPKLRRIALPHARPVLYSDGVICGNLLWISGAQAVDEQGNIVGKGDVVAQTEQVFKNLEKVLAEAGASFADVARIVIYLRDMQHRSAIAPVRERVFGPNRPASTLVAVSGLSHPDSLIEIEAVAYLGD